MHSLPRATNGERPTTSHEHLQSIKFDLLYLSVAIYIINRLAHAIICGKKHQWESNIGYP
jgi:hypothetical protein